MASVRRVVREPALFPIFVAVVAVIAINPGTFVGTRSFFGDEVGILYPWYVTALRTLWIDPTGMYDPYTLGGMPSFNFIANYDPIYAIPALLGVIPSVTQFQFLALAHGFMIPVALLSIGRARNLPGPTLWLLAAFSVCAVYVGPNVKYPADTDGSDCYAWNFVAFAALEHFRRSGRAGYAVAASLATAFAVMRFATGAVVLPVALVPLLVLYRRDIAAHPGAVRSLVVACIVGIAAILPNLVMQSKLYSTIAASIDVAVVREATRVDLLALLGMRVPDGPLACRTMFAIPGVVLVFACLALANASRTTRAVLAGIIVALGLYALGDVTPFVHVFRALYPPAALFRRPYAATEVLYPLVFVLIATHVAPLPTIRAALRPFLAGAQAALVLIATIVYPAGWSMEIVLGAAGILALYFTGKPLVLSAALAVQWLIIVEFPFTQSVFYSSSWNQSVEGFAKYVTLASFLPPPHVRASDAFRVVGIGLPGDSGGYASAYRYFSVGPSQGTRVPRLLADATGITASGFGEISTFFLQHPEVAGSDGMRAMSVRYYFINAHLDPRLLPSILAANRTLRRIPLDSYWSVVEDPGYRPFIASYADPAGVPQALDGAIGWNNVSFTVPATSDTVDIADLYDSWWTATSDDGTKLPVREHHGRLEVATGQARGHVVRMRYGNVFFSVSIVFALAAYVAALAICLRPFASVLKMGLRR